MKFLAVISVPLICRHSAVAFVAMPLQQGLRAATCLGRNAHLEGPWTEEWMTDAMKMASEEATKEEQYKSQMLALNRLLMETQGKLKEIKRLSSNLKALDMDDPSLSKLPDSAAGLKTVLQEAKAAGEVHGQDSPEAEAAWNEVDFCTDVMGGVECHVDSMYRYSAAALNAHHLYDAVVDTTSFQEAEEAVEMLESLQRFVRIEASRLNPSSAMTP